MITLWLHTPEYVEYIWIWWIDCLLNSRAAYSVYTRADVLENMLLDLPQKTNLMLVKPSVLSGWDATASRNKPSQFLFAKHWHIVWNLCDGVFGFDIYIYIIHKFWVLSHQSLCFVSVSGQSENCHRTALKDEYCFLHPWPLAVPVSIWCCIVFFFGKSSNLNERVRVSAYWRLYGLLRQLNPETWVFAHRKETHTSKLKASCDGSWIM